MCVWSIAHFTLESMNWLQFVFMVVHQSTVHPPTFSYISFIHAGDKSHHEACLHLLQFLYFAALLSCFAAPHIIFPLEGVWQFVWSLLSPLRLVVCVVMGGTVCTVGGHACMCVCVCTVFKCWASTHIYIYMYNTYLYSMYVCNCTQFVHTYIRTFVLSHSCHLCHWQQSSTCWQTTDTTPSMCGRTSSSTWPQWWCGWLQCARMCVLVRNVFCVG